MCVPGATMSGLMRPSPPAALTGPRLEKPMMSLALSAPVLPMPQPSFPVWRTFSPAPTVMMFLAVPGLLTVLAPDPSLPAAKITIICWLPPTPLCASRTTRSTSCALVS